MKIINIILGTLSLSLGIVGIFVPLLPTTPFLLLAAWLYMRGSMRLYGWLMTNRYVGHYISNYRDKKAITKSAKITSLLLLWGTILFCIFHVVDVMWVRILLGVVLGGVSVHILSFKTMRRLEDVRIRRVRSPKDIETVARLADEIWREYYSSLISTEQIEYMLDKFQSVKAIEDQIRGEGMEYYLIMASGISIGYVGVKKTGAKLMVSKFYIIKDERGKGYAREVFKYVHNLCYRKNITAMWLTVNKGNSASVDIYKKQGWSVVEEKVFDIGGGFVMDDYVMEKIVRK